MQSMVVSAHGQDGHNAVLHVGEEQDLDQGHAFNLHLQTVDEIVVHWGTRLRLRVATNMDVQVWFSLCIFLMAKS